MTLDKYLVDAKITEVELAREAGVSQATISKLRNGKMNPTFMILKAINKATNGKVSPNDFIDISQEALR